MSDDPSPWSRDPPTPAPRPRGRVWLWFVIATAIGGLVLALARAFPEARLGGGDWANVGYLVGMVLLLTAGASRLQRGALGQHLRHAAIWAGIVAALALGVAYQGELAGVAGRVRTAFSGGTPVALSDQELAVPQNDAGAYVVTGKVNGQKVRFIVDTGATDTVLSPDDARRIGIDVEALRYVRQAETAIGVGLSAPYTADRLEVGPVGFDGFEMAVNQAPMSGSLLGMSFLSRLQSFEFRGRTLTLRPRPAGD